jgi:Holliday junction resolvasome RuvABC endonuclease subunit
MISYLGIDPGLDGGFAVITDNHISLKLAMPTISKKSTTNKTKRHIDKSSVMNFLNALPVTTFIAIEEQIPVRNQSVTSVFTTAKNYGILLMAISVSVFQEPPIEVPSSFWHAHFGIEPEPKAGKSTKAQAFEIVSSIFPNTDFRKSNRARTPHDGVVDAALIAKYGQSIYTNFYSLELPTTGTQSASTVDETPLEVKPIKGVEGGICEPLDCKPGGKEPGTKLRRRVF